VLVPTASDGGTPVNLFDRVRQTVLGLLEEAGPAIPAYGHDPIMGAKSALHMKPNSQTAGRVAELVNVLQRTKQSG
jgi:hypothetical protein